MSLTPKNWKSFQHYKDRSPSWIKLHKGLLTDFTFNRLPLASRALSPMLWLLASEYEDGEITASMEEIAFRLHVSVPDLHGALTPLIDSGFFVASEALAKPEQTACLEKENIEKRERKEKPSSEKRTSGNEDFENLKKVYPRRSGNYGWKAAERKFNSLVKTGVDPKAIIAAAVRLRETLRSKIGTEFIPMPASWLNSEDFIESAVAAFVDPQVTDWDAICANYKKFGLWSRHAPGGDPESPSCQCPRDILVKHGIPIASAPSCEPSPPAPPLQRMQ